jgi:hypothetical protein
MPWHIFQIHVTKTPMVFITTLKNAVSLLVCFTFKY